jgi:tetratricopeptide (TPR) repeat protein
MRRRIQRMMSVALVLPLLSAPLSGIARGQDVAPPAPAPEAAPATPEVPAVPPPPEVPPPPSEAPAATETPAPAPAVPPAPSEPSTPTASEPATPAAPAAPEMPAAPAAPSAPDAAPAPAPAAQAPADQVAAAAPAPAPAVAQPVNPALAERLTSMASGLLRSQPPSGAIWRYATALLEAAIRLAPDEPRYQRFLIEAATRAGDTEAAIKALEQYRKLNSADEFALTQLIDLYLGRMDSSERKLAYLKSITDAERVSPVVRSFASMRSAVVLSERMQDALAQQAVVRALELNSTNIEALRIRYQLLQANNAPATERLAALLQLLLSNPAQPQVGVEVARILADHGLSQRSVEWFNQALDVHKRLGITPPNDVGVDYASQLFISGKPREAAQVAGQLTNTNPDDLNAWLLKLVLARGMDNKEVLAQTIKQSTIAATNRLATIRKEAGDAGATTRPIESPEDVALPDPNADLQFLANAKRPDLIQQYVPVAAGVAWLKIYFEEKPAQAVPFVRAVAGVMGEGNELVARLQGWSFLIAGNKDDAKVKLTAAAETDPISALGLIVLASDDPASKAKADADARTLLSGVPSRLTGAAIAQALSQRGIKPQPKPGAAELEKVLAQLPKEWLKIIEQPNLFYGVRLTPAPGRVSAAVGDPVLVEMTIQNLSEFPLTIGPDGVIHQDLWFDARTRGVQPQQYPAEAFARLSGPLVLRPRESISQIVRLDQTQLALTLEQYPTANFQIEASVLTNPTTVGGSLSQGPASIRATLTKMMERRGAPIGQPDVQQKLFTAIQSGTPAEKIRAAETLTKFATLLTGDGVGDAAKQLGMHAAEAVRRTTQDEDPAVRAWATYLYCRYSADPALLNNLLKDESWVARTLGVVGTDYLGQNHDLFKPLAENDREPVVKKLAAAALEANIRRPTTAPATTQPDAPVPAAATTPPTAAQPAGDAPALLVPETTPAPAPALGAAEPAPATAPVSPAPAAQ